MSHVGSIPLAMALCLGLTASLPAQSRRVRIQVGDRIVYATMGPGELPGFGGEGLEAPPPELPGAPPSAPAAAAPPAPAPAVTTRRPPPTRPEDLVATNQVDTGEATGEELPDPGPAPAELRSLLADIYGITDEETVSAAWWWTSREDADLPFATRAGNGVHRLLVARLSGDPVTDEYRGDPYPEGTTQALFTNNGVSVRAAPFGGRVGLLGNGEAITVLARDENNWYRVRGSSGVTGWVSGFWLRFQ